MTALVVVPCSGKKADRPTAAEQMYQGSFYKLALTAATAITRRHEETEIRILSARYGLIGLRRPIEPYDLTIGDPGSVSGHQVATQLRLSGAERVIALTPGRYTRLLADACAMVDIYLEAPLDMSRGIGFMRHRLAQIAASGNWR